MRGIGTALLSLAGFLLAWKLITVLTGTPDYILPAPEVVAERAARAIGSGLLWEHTAVTLSEILLGFAVGAATAIGVGVALGKSVSSPRTSWRRNRSRSWPSPRSSTSGSAAACWRVC